MSNTYSKSHVGNDLGEIVADVIRKRRSVRRFNKTQIPPEALRSLLEAGVNAPSGSNWQNQRFLTITNREEIERIGKTRFVWPYRNSNASTARERNPAGIIGHGTALMLVFANAIENDRRGNGEYHIWESLEIQNCAASIQNILIQATALGIGSCWVSACDSMNYTRMFSNKSWRNLLMNYEIPEFFKMQGIVVLGYTDTVDDSGFPRGEKRHGATVWKSTERKELDYYCIAKKSTESKVPPSVSYSTRIKMRFFPRLLRLCQRVAAWCDRKIHQIEVNDYPKD
ncbi:nitroreductase family protein [bacterium]|nr:nitroreductase family protein [bacterium]